ncbi:hypothetical protein NM688_g7134 [Phlebia brevispora]|uniref:Uncharacterized protein n=1 Tax=Phlebia brevispora TaxID=194682 RepID=A0ACC1S8Z6_9APHY|nr:hypothetical protein NM688_g7134 [Phlebia brevispora]
MAKLNGSVTNTVAKCSRLPVSIRPRLTLRDWIPDYLAEDTQAALRVEMEKPVSKADEEGYIYTFEILDDHAPQIYLKVGRANNVVRRIDEWSKQCGSKEQVLRGYWPTGLEPGDGTLMRGRMQPGKPGMWCHRLERLVHLELADLSVNTQYLHKEFPRASSAPSSKPNTTHNARRKVQCPDCSKFHQEIFAFTRPTDGPYVEKEWELLVKPVIEKWGGFVEAFFGGPGILQFNPSTVTAAPGDTVTFVFQQSNHSATESTFENPCEMAPGGFDSGFIPVADDNTGGPFPAAQFTVEDTNPVWVYCRQADHCQQGMVFAINPGNQFPAFQAAAMGTTLPASSATASATPAPSSSAPEITFSSFAQPPVTFSSVSQPSQTPTQSSAAPASSASTNHLVVVGGPNKLVFDPSNITAQVGDTVTFQFQQSNHTATQSTFEEPCNSLTQTSTSGQIGFDSGFMPVADNATIFPTFTINVTDTAPIWAFCKQANHCGRGMVFAVNAIASGPDNFAAFQARAIQLNGTSLNGSTSSNTTSGAARSMVAGGSGIAITIMAAFVGSLL